MAIKSLLKPCFTRKSLLIWGVYLIIALAVTLYVQSQIKFQKQALIERAEFSSIALSANLSNEIRNQRQLIQAVSEHYSQDLIAMIAQFNERQSNIRTDMADSSSISPFSPLGLTPRWQAFQTELYTFFPDLSQFALLNEKGSVVLDGDGFFMGNACRMQVEKGLMDSSSQRQPSLQAHFFHDGDTHYDLVYYLREDDKTKGVVMVSMPMSFFAPYLTRFVDSPLQVIMLNQQNANQVVISSSDCLELQSGAAIEQTWLEKSLFSQNLLDTQWRLYFVEDGDHLQQTFAQYWLYATSVLIILALLAVILNRFINFSVLAGNAQSPSRLRGSANLYAESPVALLVLDAESPNKIRYFNVNRVEQADAFKQSIILNQSFASLIHPLDHAKWLETIDLFAKKQQTTPVSLRVRLYGISSSIEVFWVELHLVPEYDAKQTFQKIKLFLLVGGSESINSMNVQEVLEKLPYPVVVTDENGLIQQLNRNAQSMLIEKNVGWENRPLASLLSLESAQKYRLLLQQAVQNFYAEVLASPRPEVLNDSALDEFSRALPIMEFRTPADGIKAYKIQIETLPSLYEKGYVHYLIPVVSENHLAPQEHNFMISYYEANLARFNIGHHIADELEELMSFLRGVSDRLKFTFIDKVSRIHADEIRFRSDAISRSLQDFKFLAMKEEDITKAPFDAYILIEESMHLLRLKARWNGVKFHFQYESSCPYVWLGYENRVKQIMLQLLSYMIEQMRCESVLVYVNCLETAQKQRKLKINFQGKDEADRCKMAIAKLHDDFSQIEEQEKAQTSFKKHRPELLGLDISVKLLKAMDGEFKLNFLEKEIVDFNIEIPVELDNSSEDYVGRENQDMLTDQPLNGQRYIVVERDTVVQQLLKDLIEKFGAQVDVVESGIDAVGFWRNYGHLYSGLLVEVDAEVMNANEVLSFIRREEHESMLDHHFPVFLLKDKRSTSIADKTLQAFDGVIEKPLMMERVLKALQGAMKE